jgi:hypothetical protein
MFLFPLVHVLHMVHVHSNKIYVLGHHLKMQMILIGIVYHQDKSVYFTMVQIILIVIQQSVTLMDIFFGQHRIFDPIKEINHRISIQKYF